jgi:elongation factor P--(R)-beta-lysine ligase
MISQMPASRQSTVQANLHLRAGTLSAIRAFFKRHDYLEVDTPVRIPAPAPEAHIEAQPSGTWYLQTSPELCMKRLLAAGYPRIFQIAKCFRQQERGGRHLPEMTLLEWYTANAGYEAMMEQCEALIAAVVQSLGMGMQLAYQGHPIALEPPWPRLTVARAFDRYGAISMQAALETDRFDAIMGLEIEPRLGWQQPVFLCDYPRACGALARRKAGRPDLVERFELYIGGLELCNAFGELTDADEQRRRFEAALARRQAAGKPAYPMPEPFLRDLAHMPPAAGNALGVERLVMLLANSACIDDVVAFTPEEL